MQKLMQYFNFFVIKIKESDTKKAFLFLSSGTTIGQIIVVLSSPILTRIFTPEQFGIYGIYIAIVSLFQIFSCCQYDRAILLPGNKADALKILKSIILMTLLFCILVFIGIKIYNDDIEKISGLIPFYQNFIPISIFLFTANIALYQYALRIKLFSTLSISGIIKSFINSVFAIFLGLFSNFGFLALIISQILGQLSSLILLFLNIKKNDVNFSKESLSGSIKLLKEHINFPKYMMPSALFHSGALRIPVLVLASFLDKAIIGHYTIVERIILTPVYIISNSISSIYSQKASDFFNNKKNIMPLLIKTFLSLCAIGFFPTAILIIFSPSLFAFIFGEEWKVAGEFTQILAIAFFFRFTILPIQYTLIIFNKQILILLIDILNILFILSGLYIGYIKNDIIPYLWINTAGVTISHLLILGFSIYYCKRGINE